jgi:hypothetical protein
MTILATALMHHGHAGVCGVAKLEEPGVILLDRASLITEYSETMTGHPEMP